MPTFALRCGALCILVLLTLRCSSGSESYDVVIHGGSLLDGTGSAARRADLGIRGDTIAAVGDLSGARSARLIDAEGLAVSPGFIDMHSHSDFTLLVDGRALSKVTQGVTTELLGESESAGPVLGPARAEREKSLSELELSLDWVTLADYFERLERQGISVNVVSTVGFGQVRASVVGYESRPPSAEELRLMEQLIEQAMREGAVGLSSGLVYGPDRLASTEELIAFAKVAAGYAGIYLTHIRGEDERLRGAVEEAIRVGREAELPVEVLHFKRAYLPLDREPDPSIQEAASLIETAQKEGVEIHANLYPYSASQTFLDTRLPDWVHQGGREEMLSRLRDPVTRRRIREELEAMLAQSIAGKTPDTILFGATPHEAHRELQGKRISEISVQLGMRPAEAIIDLVDRADGLAMAIFFGMREEDMRYALALPWTTIGSDGTAVAPQGLLARSHPHPRWYGSFPRVLGRYVREEKLLSLEEAIRKMTSLPAARLSLTDRGVLAVGRKADLVVFNPETIMDRSIFEKPHQLSQGIEYVIVNGQLVLNRGQHTGALPGRVLRHQPQR